jgi:hypothetical protein
MSESNAIINQVTSRVLAERILKQLDEETKAALLIDALQERVISNYHDYNYELENRIREIGKETIVAFLSTPAVLEKVRLAALQMAQQELDGLDAKKLAAYFHSRW